MGGEKPAVAQRPSFHGWQGPSNYFQPINHRLGLVWLQVTSARSAWSDAVGTNLLSPSHLFQVLKWEMCFFQILFRVLCFFSSGELSPLFPVVDWAVNERECSAWRSVPNIRSALRIPGPGWGKGRQKAVPQNGVQVPSSLFPRDTGRWVQSQHPEGWGKRIQSSKPWGYIRRPCLKIKEKKINKKPIAYWLLGGS